MYVCMYPTPQQRWCGILVVNANRVSSLRILAPCCVAGGGAETVLWTADYRGDSQAKADEVVRPCAENGPGETDKGHVLGDAGR